MKALAALILLVSTSASAEHVVQLHELSLDYARARDGGRDPVLPGTTEKERLDLHLDMDIWRYGFFNNMIHSLSDEEGFRLIGWNYRLGAHLGTSVDVYYEHFSQHFLDRPYPGAFPLRNEVGVQIYLLRSTN